MKKTKIGLIAAMALFAGVSLTSCGESADFKVGILQYVTHDALNKATEGFKAELEAKAKAAGKKISFVVKNPEADNAQLGTMATQLVRSCDLVLGNATPAATQLVTARATEGKTNLPILFTSVTDPVDAKLVSSMKNHKENVTGTSDLNPIEKQFEMMFDVDDEIDKIGFLYTVSEPNSKVQCDTAIEWLKSEKGFTDSNIFVQTVSDQSGISAATTKLCNDGCDFIYLPTDNLMAANMTTITNVTNDKHVPTMCGEESMVTNGGTFTISISYEQLGHTTGEMAAKILFEGKKASEIDAVVTDDATKMVSLVNMNAVRSYGITLSDAFKTKYKINN